MEKRHTDLKGTWAYSAPKLHKKGTLVVGAAIRVCREPTNQYDRNASAVFLGDDKLGMLPKALAAETAPYFDGGGSYSGTISYIGTATHNEKSYPSVYVDIFLHDLKPLPGLSELLRDATSFLGNRGIYQIENLVNRRRYIGSAANVGRRLQQHISELTNGGHANHFLAEDWRKMGPCAFRFSLIERIPRGDLLERERHYIQHLKTHLHGYNQTSDGVGKLPLSATTRSKLGLDRVPPSPAIDLSRPSNVDPSRSPVRKTRAAQGCSLLVFCLSGLFGVALWQALVRILITS